MCASIYIYRYYYYLVLMHACGCVTQIIECQKETELLLYEKQWWPKVRESLEHSLKKTGAELRSQTKRNSIQKSIFEKELENLNIKLKREEDFEYEVRLILSL